MNLTDEQEACAESFLTGQPLVIQALAGTGKTTTLDVMARLSTQRGRYVAYNKAIVTEAQAKFPNNVACSTMHSMAFGPYRSHAHRLATPRMRGWQLAKMLGIDGLDLGEKRLSAPWCAGAVMRAMKAFRESDDLEPSRAHIGFVQGLDVAGDPPPPATGAEAAGSSDPTPDPPPPSRPNHEALCDHLEPWLAKAWADLASPTGQLPFSHDDYFKLWQLADPFVPADFLMVDEAQDLSPVQVAAIRHQSHAQVILVGDSHQTIYGWRGCVDALLRFPEAATRYLTGSFRFGAPVADLANRVLSNLDAEIELVGLGGPSRIGHLSRPDAIVARSNGGVVAAVMEALSDGRAPVILGGAGQLIAWVAGAKALQEGRPTDHPDLGCFGTWHDVQQFVLEDPQGDDLALMVRLVDRFGARELLAVLEAADRRPHHDVVVTTAHKAKGREWPNVQLRSDFVRAHMTPEEWRCTYVAVTRARAVLDPGDLEVA